MGVDEDYTGELPAGWTGGQHVSKWWRGIIVHLYTLRKPCAECKHEMRIDVTKAAIQGVVKNAGLHLRRCPACRARTKAIGATSRPKIEGSGGTLEIVETPDESLRTANTTMRQELTGLYAQVKELRKRLAKYELASAVDAVAKMPWE